MVSHGYIQNADVCARRVFVVQGDHLANTHAVGPKAPTCPPSLPMKLTPRFPERSGICVICVTNVIREFGSVQDDAKRCRLEPSPMTQGGGAMTQNATRSRDAMALTTEMPEQWVIAQMKG
jgi:hypothetical protein